MMKAPLGLESEVETQDPKTLPEMESEVETLRRLVQEKERMERELSVLKDQNVALEQQLSEYTEVIKYQPRVSVYRHLLSVLSVMAKVQAV